MTGTHPTRPRDRPPSSAGGPRLYARILAYFRADRRLITGLVALIWIALAVGALQPVVIAILTDSVLGNAPPANALANGLLRTLPGATEGRVLLLAITWVLLQVTNDTVTLLREMINNQLRYNGTARARYHLFDHLQGLGPAYHRARSQGDSIYRLSTDTLGFFGVLDTFVGAANSFLTLVVIGFVMLGWNVRITLVALCLAPLLVIANAYFGRTIRRTSLLSKQADEDYTTFVQRGVASIGLVQLFGRERRQFRRFEEVVARTIKAGRRMNWQQQLHPLAQRVIYAVGYGFVLGYGGYLVIRGRGSGATGGGGGGFTVGGILALTFYLAQLWEPLRRITGFTADVQVNVAACVRVFHVLDLPPAVTDAPGAMPLPLRPRTLVLEDVQFDYGGDGKPVLRRVSTTIEPGAMVAFIGPSGAGKSTLLNLLPRFYDPTGGRLRLDEFDLRDVRLSDVRRHIALVPQDSPVVACTVMENIAFGHPSASDMDVRAAAEMAGAASFIEELPGAYAFEVSEGGQNFSGGQRQRIAIARALLAESPILVLDEPTSGLDRHHERQVLQALHALRGQRTIILVTHSLEAASGCDVIHVLDQGRIVETGTHAELIARGGLYASMASDHQHQAKRSLRFTPAASVSAAPDSPLLAGRRIRGGANSLPPA